MSLQPHLSLRTDNGTVMLYAFLCRIKWCRGAKTVEVQMQYHKNTGNVQGFFGGKGERNGKGKGAGEKNFIYKCCNWLLDRQNSGKTLCIYPPWCASAYKIVTFETFNLSLFWAVNCL